MKSAIITGAGGLESSTDIHFLKSGESRLKSTAKSMILPRVHLTSLICGPETGRGGNRSRCGPGTAEKAVSISQCFPCAGCYKGMSESAWNPDLLSVFSRELNRYPFFKIRRIASQINCNENN